MPRLSRVTESIFAPLNDYLPGWAATPRSAAAAVLGMLGFGVIIGSMVGAGVAGTLRPAEILLAGGPPAGSDSGNAINAGGSGGGGGGGSGGGPRTVIETITNGSGGGGAGGATSTGESTTSPTTTTPTTSTSIPAIKHVFLIMLSDAGYYQTFASNNPYFGKKLPKAGEVVPFYYGVTQGELANQIAMLSGQGPTQQTASDCPQFTRFARTGTSQYKEVLGSGCVYPSGVESLPEQLAAGKRGGFRAYIQGLGTAKSVADARRRAAARGRAVAARARGHETATTTTGTTTTTSTTGTTSTTSTTTTTSSPPPPCAHPALGASDPHATATQADPYVTWRNPIVYFASTIDSKGCRKLDVSLSELPRDLKSKKTTPALSYISPDPCDDGSSQPCHAGAPAGLRPAQRFLQTVLPEIERSSAYRSGGLIIITADQAPQSGPNADSSSCCNQPTYPNIPASTTTTGTTTTSTGTTSTGTTTTGTGTGTTTTGTTPTGTGTGPTTPGTTTTGTTTTPSTSTGSPGGGQVGMLLISKYVKPGTQDALDYFNHFSLLASLENLFKLPKLGYAKAPGLSVFTATLFNAGSSS